MRKVCFESIYKLAKSNRRIVFVGSDLGAGVLDNFKNEMPERFFMEGVSEAHMIGMSAGLALEGNIVYAATIAVFITRRCYEQNVLELGKHNLKVRLIGIGGGLVYAPLGTTHLAIEDIAIMRVIPNMTVVAVSDAIEMEKLMTESVNYPGPIYIRVAKGGEKIITPKNRKFKIGKAYLVKKGKKVLVITTGVTQQIAWEASEKLNIKGIDISILHIPTIKPLDVKTLVSAAKNSKIIITIEEHTVFGGLGSAVTEILSQKGLLNGRKFKIIGIPDVFPKGYGSQTTHMEKFGITSSRLYSEIQKLTTYSK